MVHRSTVVALEATLVGKFGSNDCNITATLSNNGETFAAVKSSICNSKLTAQFNEIPDTDDGFRLVPEFSIIDGELFVTSGVDCTCDISAVGFEFSPKFTEYFTQEELNERLANSCVITEIIPMKTFRGCEMAKNNIKLGEFSIKKLSTINGYIACETPDNADGTISPDILISLKNLLITEYGMDANQACESFNVVFMNGNNFKCANKHCDYMYHCTCDEPGNYLQQFRVNVSVYGNITLTVPSLHKVTWNLSIKCEF